MLNPSYPSSGSKALAASHFLELVDQVLADNGRRPMDDVNRKIVMVEDSDRVLQILAGPGSGKTEMLVWRVLYELFVRRTPARRVLVTTFTRKAATELEVRIVERSDALIEKARASGFNPTDPRVHDLRIGTIHSLCDAMLAEFDVEYMEQGTQLIDEHETLVRLARCHRYILGYSGAGTRVIDRLLDCEPLVSLFRAPWETNNRWPANEIQRVTFLSALLGQHTETWIPRCSEKSISNGIEKVHGPADLTADLQKLHSRWVSYLSDQHVTDFATLQCTFHSRQETLLGQLDHVFVDEFQDTNPIQYAIHTRWVAHKTCRLTVVGDDDQAMYRFRGSDIDCYAQLESYCSTKRIPFRREKLEKNWRSTQSIVAFSQQFKATSVLAAVSMPKQITAGDCAEGGTPVRLLRGSWDQLTKVVAEEITTRTPPPTGDPSTALLFFSTSERGREATPAPVRLLRGALENKGLRTYNPRNKMAAYYDSPIAELLGLLSYFIDPITLAPIGKRNNKPIMVCACDPDKAKAKHALTKPPPTNVNRSHLAFQKHFIKDNGGEIGAPVGDRATLLDYLDDIRSKLANVCTKGQKPRLTFAGLVARLLSFPRYRNTGYTIQLFRQAQFTALLESNIAPSRLTKSPLDRPLWVELEAGKYVWPREYWYFIGTLGSLLEESNMDDEEIEAFEAGAIPIMTFHQSKGLEFDHVYIGGTGRNISPHNVLRTMLFSGKIPKYTVVNGQPTTKNKEVLQLATADRDRELYVAMTRAKRTLTFMHDPNHDHPLMAINEFLAKLFATAKPKVFRKGTDIELLEVNLA